MNDVYTRIEHYREVIRSNAETIDTLLSDASDASPRRLGEIETELRGAVGEVEGALKLLGEALDEDARQAADEDQAERRHEDAMARAEERALRIAECDVQY